MNHHHTDTVLLICDDEPVAASILDAFAQADVRVIGPVQTARMALALAAQVHPTLAVLATPPTGQRNTRQLAQALMTTWGVPSLILDGADHGETSADLSNPTVAVSWNPRPGQTERLGPLLSQALASRAA